MRFVTILVLFSTLLAGCAKKDPGGDTGGNSYIHGRLFLVDPTKPGVTPTGLGGKHVFIAYAGTADLTNYLTADTTDASGYFTFFKLDPKKQYRLSYQDTINSIIYFAMDSVTPPTATFGLYAGLSNAAQNGIWAQLTDSTGGAVNGASLFVFQAPGSGYLDNSGSNSNYSVTASPEGLAYKLNIPPRTYYLLATASIDGLPYIGRDTVGVSDTLIHVPIILNAPNGFRFITVDAINRQPLPNVSVCLFMNQTAAAKGTCDGSSYSVTSGADGTIAKYNIPARNYYINATVILGKDTLVGNQTISLGSSILTDTIAVHVK